MPEGADLLHVGRMLIELDALLAFFEFERDGFTLKQKGDTETVTIALTRKKSVSKDLARPSASGDGEQSTQAEHPGQMKLVAEEPEGEE